MIFRTIARVNQNAVWFVELHFFDSNNDKDIYNNELNKFTLIDMRTKDSETIEELANTFISNTANTDLFVLHLSHNKVSFQKFLFIPMPQTP